MSSEILFNLTTDSRHFPRISLPRVSVIVTCFNYGTYIHEALESVASQTYALFDCVVVDDCSTDDSASIAEIWIANKNDTRFKLLRNPRNLGQMGCFRAGLAASESEFVAFLDADDVWFPDYLARHIDVHLNRVQPAGMSSSDLVQIDSEGRLLGGSSVPPLLINQPRHDAEAGLLEADFLRLDDRTVVPTANTLEARYVFASWGIWHWSVTSGMVFRRPLLNLLIPLDTDAFSCADVYLANLSHYFTGSFVIRSALGGYRRHGKNGYSSLPVSGSAGSAPFQPSRVQLSNMFIATLRHLLNSHDSLSTVFGPMMVHRLVLKLFRQFLRDGIVFEDDRLANVLGSARVARYRLKARIGFLRRRIR